MAGQSSKGGRYSAGTAAVTPAIPLLLIATFPVILPDEGSASSWVDVMVAEAVDEAEIALVLEPVPVELFLNRFEFVSHKTQFVSILSNSLVKEETFFVVFPFERSGAIAEVVAAAAGFENGNPPSPFSKLSVLTSE